MAGLEDNHLAASALKFSLQILVTSIADFFYFVIGTAHDGVEAYREPDGRVERTAGILIVEVGTEGFVTVVGPGLVHAIHRVFEFFARGEYGSRNSGADSH